MKSFPAVLLIFLVPAIVFSAGAPHKIDQDLRARVSEFYNLIIQHKARAAEALVAADTKDYYYDSQKPDMESFEIAGISYGPSFRTAEVTLSVRMHMFFPGAGPQTVPMKFPSTWKIERGAWCWYVDKSRLASSPFGQFHPDASSTPAQPIVSPEKLTAAVKVDRNRIGLDVQSNAAESVTFTNNLPGPVTLQAPNVPGVKIEVPKPSLAAGESAKVSFRYDQAGLQSRTAVFTVLPTNQQIPIELFFYVNNH